METELTEQEKKVIDFLKKEYKIETMTLDCYISDLGIGGDFELCFALCEAFGFDERVDGDELSHAGINSTIAEVLAFVKAYS